MAKLYFYYSAMNAGKSTILLQAAYNYQERGMDTLLFTSELDNRFGDAKIHSRIGLNAEAVLYNDHFDLFKYTKRAYEENPNIKCVLIDEAQFLSKEQVQQLTAIVDKLNLPVLAYGLRSDYQGEPFPGSMYLMVWADNLVEIKTICYCGKKAMMNLRTDAEGRVVRTGEQIQIGGNERYTSMCRKHFNEAREVKNS